MFITPDTLNSISHKRLATFMKYAGEFTEFKLSDLYADDLITLLHDDITNGNTTTILDIGCGTGTFAHAYIRAFPNGIPGQTIISTDISSFMLEQAYTSTIWKLDHPIHQSPNQPKIAQKYATSFLFQMEDGTQLSGIADHSIDIVVSVHGVFLIPDQVSTLQSIKRVLKPRTGIFANVAWTKPDGIDPSFGSNFDDTFLVLAMKVKEMKMTDRSDSSIPVEPPVVSQWSEPTTIATNLTKRHNFAKVKSYRMLHSMIDRNFHAFFEMGMINPMIEAESLSDEQRHTLKHTLFDLCQIPHSSIEEKENIIQNDNLKVPFTLWTASNLTIAHVV